MLEIVIPYLIVMCIFPLSKFSFTIVYVDDYAMNQNENKTRKYVNILLYIAISIYVPYNFKFVATIDHEYRSLSVHHKVAQRGFIEHYSNYSNEILSASYRATH